MLAGNVDKPEIVTAVRELCAKQNVPLVPVESRSELGRIVGQYKQRQTEEMVEEERADGGKDRRIVRSQEIYKLAPCSVAAVVGQGRDDDAWAQLQPLLPQSAPGGVDDDDDEVF